MYANLMAELGRKGISIAKLSRMTGIKMPTLYDKIRGRYDFSFSQILRIKEVLNVDMPVEELFQRETT